jgi:hypothetical protein
LALVYPPSGGDRAEAAEWIKGARGPHSGSRDEAN